MVMGCLWLGIRGIRGVDCWDVFIGFGRFWCLTCFNLLDSGLESLVDRL